MSQPHRIFLCDDTINDDDDDDDDDVYSWTVGLMIHVLFKLYCSAYNQWPL